MTKIGAVNCRTMVFAAVVSLLATVNRVLVPQMHTAPTRIQRLNRGLCLVAQKIAANDQQCHHVPPAVDRQSVPGDDFDAKPPDAVQDSGQEYK